MNRTLGFSAETDKRQRINPVRKGRVLLGMGLSCENGFVRGNLKLPGSEIFLLSFGPSGFLVQPSQSLVEEGARSHCRGGFGIVRKVVATQIDGLALGSIELIDDGLFVFTHGSGKG